MKILVISPSPNKDGFSATCARMGIVDDACRPRNSWCTLQEEFAHLILEQVDFTFPYMCCARAEVIQRTRGPIEADQSVYTLRHKRVVWQAHSPAEKPLEPYGEARLPVLPPGTIYTSDIALPRLEKGSSL
jgi:hypothetical protein